MNPETKLSYIVTPNDFLNAGAVSEDIKTKLSEMNINNEIIRKATLAVYETELNMIIHANGGLIDVEITPDVLRVEAADNGPGIADPEMAMNDGYTTVSPDSEIRARGLGNGQGFSKIRKNTDSFEIETELGCGTTVRFEIYLS
ncbi:ATP-binding protein [Ruminococcus sp. HUN007]|uniref:ATP-binding protein n=1 Tax=Ruminococcus sp. HUN007 TaxID=1514668 RepID=UPI0005D23487|nr:ATP-binding protein [Ruminococcus sp. HUN007]